MINQRKLWGTTPPTTTSPGRALPSPVRPALLKHQNGTQRKRSRFSEVRKDVSVGGFPLPRDVLPFGPPLANFALSTSRSPRRTEASPSPRSRRRSSSSVRSFAVSVTPAEGGAALAPEHDADRAASLPCDRLLDPRQRQDLRHRRVREVLDRPHQDRGQDRPARRGNQDLHRGCASVDVRGRRRRPGS